LGDDYFLPPIETEGTCLAFKRSFSDALRLMKPEYRFSKPERNHIFWSQDVKNY